MNYIKFKAVPVRKSTKAQVFFFFQAGHCSVVGFAIVPFFAAHQMFNLLSRWKQLAVDMFELVGHLPIEQEQENGDLHAKLHDVTRKIAENATNSDVAPSYFICPYSLFRCWAAPKFFFPIYITNDVSVYPFQVYQQNWKKLKRKMNINPATSRVDVAGKYHRIWMKPNFNPKEVKAWYDFGALAYTCGFLKF